ncbi:MAG: hypothetical protein AAGB26_00735 [Planctomycetota bacterium]
MSERNNLYQQIGLPPKQACRGLWHLLIKTYQLWVDRVPEMNVARLDRSTVAASRPTQAQIAHICGVSRSVMSRSLSLNQPNHSLPGHSFKKAANALDISIADLLCKVKDAHVDSIDSPRFHFSLALIHIMAARLSTQSEQDAIAAVASCVGVEESRVWDIYFHKDVNGFGNEVFHKAATSTGLELPNLFARLKHTHYQRYSRIFLDSRLRPLPKPETTVDQAVMSCSRFLASKRFRADTFLSCSGDLRRSVEEAPGQSNFGHSANILVSQGSRHNHTEFHAASRLFTEIVRSFPLEIFEVGLADSILLVIEIGVLKTIVRINFNTCKEQDCEYLCELDFFDLPYPIERGISECWDSTALETPLHKARVGYDSWSYKDVRSLFDETHDRAFELSFLKVYCDAIPFISHDGYLRVTMIGSRPAPCYPPAPIDNRPDSVELLWLLLCESVAKVWSDSSLGKRCTNKTPLKDSNRLDRHNVSWLEALPHHILYKFKHRAACEEMLLGIDRLFVSCHEITESIIPGKLYASEVWFYDFSYMRFTQNLKARNPLSSEDLYRVYPESNDRSLEDQECVLKIIQSYLEFAAKRIPPRPNGKTALAVNQGRAIVLSSRMRESQNAYDKDGRRLFRAPEQEYLGDDIGTYIQCPIDISEKQLGRKLRGAIAFRFTADIGQEVEERLLAQLSLLDELQAAHNNKPLSRNSVTEKTKSKNYQPTLSPMATY